MIPKCEIIIEMYSQINYGFYFFKREYLIFESLTPYVKFSSFSVI